VSKRWRIAAAATTVAVAVVVTGCSSDREATSSTTSTLSTQEIKDRAKKLPGPGVVPFTMNERVGLGEWEFQVLTAQKSAGELRLTAEITNGRTQPARLDTNGLLTLTDNVAHQGVEPSKVEGFDVDVPANGGTVTGTIVFPLSKDLTTPYLRWNRKDETGRDDVFVAITG
jgi:hypothetical protein